MLILPSHHAERYCEDEGGVHEQLIVHISKSGIIAVGALESRKRAIVSKTFSLHYSLGHDVIPAMGTPRWSNQAVIYLRINLQRVLGIIIGICHG